MYNIIKRPDLIEIIISNHLLMNSTTEHNLEAQAPLPTRKKSINSEDIFKYVNFVVTSILLFCVKGFLEFR